MDNELQQQLNKIFNELPKLAKDAFTSLDLDNEFKKIREIDPLDEYKRNALKNEIFYIFLGLKNAQDLAINIKMGVEVTLERAKNIAAQVENNILLPNIEILKMIFDTPKEGEGDKNIASDGIIPQKANLEVPIKNKIHRIDNSIEKRTEPEATTTTTESNLPDIFKKRLEQPEYTQPQKQTIPNNIKKVEIPEVKEKTTEQPMKSPTPTYDSVASDPYKESID